MASIIPSGAIDVIVAVAAHTHVWRYLGKHRLN
jgi:hypothetical protein